MNLLPLLLALVPWATSPVSVLTRVFVADCILTVQMQLLVFVGAGSLQTLWPGNLMLAAVLAAWQWRQGARLSAWSPSDWRVAPWPAVIALAALVAFLNLSLPFEAADAYHLDRVTQIERLGTPAYDPAAEPKVNIVGWVYELLLADLRQVPVLGSALVRLHGLLGLCLYVVTLAAVRTFQPAGRGGWPLTVLLVVPVVFHQFVLVKNDLFLLGPALVALVWLTTSSDRASWRDALWAGWLGGFAVGAKVSSLPLALVLAGGILVAGRGRDWRPFLGLAAGGLLGGVTSGLPLTLAENMQWYGDPTASVVLAEIGNRTTSLGEALESMMRFGISLFDLGLVTPVWWPGRGGWGGTFGLPLVWALGVLLLCYRRAREARWALWSAAACGFTFAALYPDTDVTQRLLLAPGLLVVLTAVHLLDREDGRTRLARLALVPVILLSVAHILRSAVLYFYRG